MEPKVTVILVAYRSQSTIDMALRSLLPSHEHGLLECVVVDNDSTDRTVSIVREQHPWATIVQSGENLGYGRACNLGLESARTPYVLFMNPDSTIGQDAVECLIRFLEEHPGVGMVAPALIGGGELQGAGGLPSPASIVMQTAGLRTKSMRQRPIHPGEPPFRTNWLCGALLMMPTGLVREMGGFDSRIFLYFEETDLCRRILKRRLELWAVGEAVGYHAGNVSTDQSDQKMRHGHIIEHYYRSRFYYLTKYWSWPVAVLTEISELGLLGLKLLYKRIRGRDAEEVMTQIRRPRMKMPILPEKGG